MRDVILGTCIKKCLFLTFIWTLLNLIYFISFLQILWLLSHCEYRRKTEQHLHQDNSTWKKYRDLCVQRQKYVQQFHRCQKQLSCFHIINYWCTFYYVMLKFKKYMDFFNLPWYFCWNIVILLTILSWLKEIIAQYHRSAFFWIQSSSHCGTKREKLCTKKKMLPMNST